MAALAELERLMGHALVAALACTAGELTVTSTLRGAHYTVVTVGGSTDTRAIRRLLWAALRCPEGLGDVPEPGSAARYRAFIDTAAHGRFEWWGRRR